MSLGDTPSVMHVVNLFCQAAEMHKRDIDKLAEEAYVAPSGKPCWGCTLLSI